MILLPAHPAQDNSELELPEDVNGLWDTADDCAIKTAILLHETLSATEEELQKTLDLVRDQHASGKPCEFLEQLARVQGHQEEHIGPAILKLSNRMAAAMQPVPPVVPFAGKLIAPSAFYESFDQLHLLAKVLLSLVLYAEDSDAIGTGSINPVSASILAEKTAAAVHRRLGIQPFICHCRMDYESWSFLTRKHFEL